MPSTFPGIQAFKLEKAQVNGPKNSTVLITGAASGFGLATAQLMHDLGNNIIAVDRQPPTKDASAALLGSPRFLFQQCELTSWKSQRAAFEAGYKKFGSITHVFVNAGIAEVRATTLPQPSAYLKLHSTASSSSGKTQIRTACSENQTVGSSRWT
jgi:NAD(P)-dependent dehydrogenase (short-subunit alcohol dehydrogenase family)